MLRHIDEQDLAKMLEWRNNPKLKQYFREYRVLTVVDQARWFESLSDDRSRQMFAIWYDGQMVGCCGLTTIDWVNRSAEVSIYLGEPVVGGAPVYIDDKVAPMAIQELKAYAFDTCGLHRLWVEVFDYDDKKQKLLIGEGFKEEGRMADTHFEFGKFNGSVMYGYLESAWRSA